MRRGGRTWYRRAPGGVAARHAPRSLSARGDRETAARPLWSPPPSASGAGLPIEEARSRLLAGRAPSVSPTARQPWGSSSRHVATLDRHGRCPLPRRRRAGAAGTRCSHDAAEARARRNRRGHRIRSASASARSPGSSPRGRPTGRSRPSSSSARRRSRTTSRGSSASSASRSGPRSPRRSGARHSRLSPLDRALVPLAPAPAGVRAPAAASSGIARVSRRRSFQVRRGWEPMRSSDRARTSARVTIDTGRQDGRRPPERGGVAVDGRLGLRQGRRRSGRRRVAADRVGEHAWTAAPRRATRRPAGRC